MGNAVFATISWLMGGITSYPRRDCRVRLDCGASFCWCFLMLACSFPPSWRKLKKMGKESSKQIDNTPRQTRRNRRFLVVRLDYLSRRFFLTGGTPAFCFYGGKLAGVPPGRLL
ncbi:uncharacterized protein EV154DRAFT_552965 [Mucor mucedo]|uniref:uncharacterized protein n=1 Tax=Mucor mucedo TaxID=29922 RepID=UPI00221EF2FC|nr:uncharacterized protein EV154DRAFT_552965 [Mucor mucedo]KAI7889596.1 hypothetical protein EV154DRAFT_552965 [Mucor mucedo]